MVDNNADQKNNDKQADTKFMNKIGNKLVEEQTSNSLDVSKKDLEMLNMGNDTKKDQKITIKETDIKVIENDLEIPYDEAKALLIQNYGDVNKVIQAFLKDFKFNGNY